MPNIKKKILDKIYKFIQKSKLIEKFRSDYQSDKN